LPFALLQQRESVRSRRLALNKPTEPIPTGTTDASEPAVGPGADVLDAPAGLEPEPGGPPAPEPKVPGDRLGPPLGGTRDVPDYGRPSPSYVFLVLVSLLTLAADIGTKSWAERRLDGYPGTLEVWKNHLTLILAKNRGGAWGLLQSTSENVRRPFFLLVSVAAIAFIVTLYRRLQPRQRALRWGLPLVLGGALGNVFDRIRYGHVIDFIDAHIILKNAPYHWPTFNVADIAICVGVGLMAIDMFTSKRGRAPVRRASPVPPAQSGEPVPDPSAWYPGGAPRDHDGPSPPHASPALGDGEPAAGAPEATAPEANR
jgi:signal peptidase II